jgi:predicted transcriptional regulator YdeE
MSCQVEHEPSITVMGIFTRASNAEPHKIGDLWRRFHAMGNAKAISARLTDAHYGVYCEYERDHTKPFTVVIGCAVPLDAEVLEGMKKITIEAGSFAVYKAEGELPQGVFNAWAEIWQTPLDRLYQADYDRYDETGATVYVGVR